MRDQTFKCETCRSDFAFFGIHQKTRLQFPPVPILPIERLLDLPDARHCKYAGVYFVLRQRQLIYIGQSKHCSKRIGTDAHRVVRGDDDVRLLAVNWPYQLAVEAAYIEHYKPSENRRDLLVRRKPGRRERVDPALQPRWEMR